MKTMTCPQCGYTGPPPTDFRCPRCSYQLLDQLKCSGNCKKCPSKNAC